MVAISSYEMFSFPPVKPLPSLYKDQSTITVSLPPNKHFNLTITAYNGYGNTSTTVVISKCVLKKTMFMLNILSGRFIWCCWCLCQHLISHGTGVSLQHWLTGQRVFGVSNRHRHRCNILQSGLEIIGHTSQHVSMSLLQWSSVYRGVLSRGVWHWERWECVISTSINWRDCNCVGTIFMWIINSLCYARIIFKL